MTTEKERKKRAVIVHAVYEQKCQLRRALIVDTTYEVLIRALTELLNETVIEWQIREMRGHRPFDPILEKPEEDEKA